MNQSSADQFSPLSRSSHKKLPSNKKMEFYIEDEQQTQRFKREAKKADRETKIVCRSPISNQPENSQIQMDRVKEAYQDDDLSKYCVSIFNEPIQKDFISHYEEQKQQSKLKQEKEKFLEDKERRRNVIRQKTFVEPKTKFDQFHLELVSEQIEEQLVKHEQQTTMNNKLKLLYNKYFVKGEETIFSNQKLDQNQKKLVAATQEKLIGFKIKKFILNLYYKRPYYLRLTQDDHDIVHDIASSDAHFIPEKQEKEETRWKIVSLLLLFLSYFSKIFNYFDQQYPPMKPESKFLQVWDGFHTLTIILSIYYVPLQWIYAKRFIYEYTWGFKYLIYIVAISFGMNVIFLMNQGFYEEGQLVVNRIQIFKKFFQKYLFCQIISFIPVLDSIFFFSRYGTVFNLVVFLKLQTFNQIVKGYEEIFMNRRIPLLTSIIKLNRLIMLLVFLTHLIAILFLGISRIDTGYHLNWITKYPDNGTFVLSQQDWDIQYIYAFYWSATTMTTVGYGDITPANPYQALLNIVILFLSVYIYSYSFSLINDVVKELNQGKNAEKKRIIHMVERYFFEKGISNALRVHIRREIDRLYCDKIQLSNDEMSELKSLFQQFDINTQNRLVKEQSLIHIEKCPPIYFNFSEESLHKIAYQLKTVDFKHRDVIFNEKENFTDENSYIYFIKEGQVQLYIKSDKNKVEHFRPVKVLNQFDYFGELNFFLGTPRVCSARSQGHSQIMMISREKFLQIISLVPEDYEKFIMIKDSLLNPYVNLLKYQCFSCAREGHTVLNCPKLHFVVDQEKLFLQNRLQFHRFVINQQRKPISRHYYFQYIQSNQEYQELLQKKCGIDLELLRQQEEQQIELELQQEKQRKEDELQEEIEKFQQYQEGEQRVINSFEKKEKEELVIEENQGGQLEERNIFSTNDNRQKWLLNVIEEIKLSDNNSNKNNIYRDSNNNKNNPPSNKIEEESKDQDNELQVKRSREEILESIFGSIQKINLLKENHLQKLFHKQHHDNNEQNRILTPYQRLISGNHHIPISISCPQGDYDIISNTPSPRVDYLEIPKREEKKDREKELEIEQEKEYQQQQENEKEIEKDKDKEQEQEKEKEQYVEKEQETQGNNLLNWINITQPQLSIEKGENKIMIKITGSENEIELPNNYFKLLNDQKDQIEGEVEDEQQQKEFFDQFLKMSKQELLEIFDYCKKFKAYNRQGNKMVDYYYNVNLERIQEMREKQKQNKEKGRQNEIKLQNQKTIVKRDEKYHLFKPELDQNESQFKIELTK